MKKFIVLFLVGISQVNSATSSCGNNCLYCYLYNSRPTCGFCFNSQLKDGKCISSELNSNSNNCIISSRHGCEVCPEPQAESSYQSGKCVDSSSKIDRCLVSFYNYEGKIACSICKDGYPSPKGDVCLGKTDEEMPENCEWAKRNVAFGGSPRCFKCKEGYVVGVDGASCVKSITEGCLQIGFSYICIMCDGWNGYTHDLFKCKKTV